MALSTDWEWIFILSVFSLLSGLAFGYYTVSFDENGVPNYFISNESTNGIVVGVNSNGSGSLSYLQGLSVQQPSQTPIVFKYFFGTLFGIFVGLLIWRLARSGGG